MQLTLSISNKNTDPIICNKWNKKNFWVVKSYNKWNSKSCKKNSSRHEVANEEIGRSGRILKRVLLKECGKMNDFGGKGGGNGGNLGLIFLQTLLKREHKSIEMH